MPDPADPRVRAALGLAAAAVFAIGVATAVGRGGRMAPAATPEQAARELFEATKRGDCDALLSLLTPRFRDELAEGFARTSVDPAQARELLCLSMEAEPTASLRRVEVRDRTDDAAVALIVVAAPDGSETADAVPFVRQGGRWLAPGDEVACLDPAAAEPTDCRRFELPDADG